MQEEVIKKYFKSWLDNDGSVLRDIFHEKVIYSECYGPEYHGLDTIEIWFRNWNKRGKVLAWDIKEFIHEKNKTVVEWYFKCSYDGNIDDFDGVSIIVFNEENKIINLKEFQSKLPHYCPANN